MANPLNLSTEDERRIKGLADKMRQLLEDNLLKPSDEGDDGIVKAKQIREEIESYGILVNTEMKINVTDLSVVEVIISLYVPVKKSPPEDQGTTFH